MWNSEGEGHRAMAGLGVAFWTAAMTMMLHCRVISQSWPGSTEAPHMVVYLDTKGIVLVTLVTEAGEGAGDLRQSAKLSVCKTAA